MDTRLFPIPQEYFDHTIKPLIEGDYIWKGRPPKINHYHVFCAILYILRTGCPWRDLPSCYGKWHPIYLRFTRGGENGLWWRVLMKLQQGKKVTMNIALSGLTNDEDSPPRRRKRGAWFRTSRTSGAVALEQCQVSRHGPVV